MASSPFSLDGYDASPISTPLFGVPMGGVSPDRPADQGSLPTSEPTIKPKHHGFLNDALGFLGDFLLSRLHMGTPYRDAKHNEELQIASQNYDQDPQAAFTRMAGIDFNDAVKFANIKEDNRRTAAQQASTQEAREARLAMQQQVNRDKNRGIVASALNALGNVDPDKRAANYASWRSRFLPLYGKDDPELSTLLPENYDPVALDSFTGSFIPVGVQRGQALTAARDATNAALGNRRADQGDRRLDQGDRALDQGDTRIRDTETRDANTNARGNRALDIRGQAVTNSNNYRTQSLAERTRHNKAAESARAAAPKSGDIVTLPDGTKAKIK